MASTVLIAANDKSTTATLSGSFNKKEFSILTAHSGRQALAQAKTRVPDAVIVDTTSPRLNSKRICRALRSDTCAVIILLASNVTKTEQMNGANLVLPKSITMKKLVPRVRLAIENKPPREIRAGNLILDVEKRRVIRGSKAHRLTPKEFELLKLFLNRPGEILSRPLLMKEIWDTDYLGDTRTLDVHIRWLREKIEENASHPRLLITVRGQGYRLESKKE